MTLLMTFHPAQDIEQADGQGILEQGLADQGFIDTEKDVAALPKTADQQAYDNPTQPTPVTEGFEPEFDGDLKSMSWAHLRLFQNSEDF